MTPTATGPLVGELIRNTVLGSVATYRVCAHAGDLVDVEVVDAPGLERGQRLRLTADAVRAMEHLGEASPASLRGRLSRRPRLSEA
jgi:hypothetical protein